MVPTLHRELSLLRAEELRARGEAERRAAHLRVRPAWSARLGHRLVAAGNRLIERSSCDDYVTREAV